jgi:hypothetical protein
VVNGKAIAGKNKLFCLWMFRLQQSCGESNQIASLLGMVFHRLVFT